MAALSRTLGIFGAFAAVVGAAFYPIYFRPLLLPEEYMKHINIQEEDFTAQFSHIFREVPSSLTNKMKAAWEKLERTVNKPSWYRSRGYSTCRAKSVVGSIWKKVTLAAGYIAKLKMEIFSSFFFH